MAAGRPWLSIVMPAWNGERYLQAALESVRREGVEGYEILAVDDGSTDRTPEILRSWAALVPRTGLSITKSSTRRTAVPGGSRGWNGRRWPLPPG